MATRISPPQNKTYYINPAYLSFVENSGYGANLIQVSASSSCYISVYDPANGIGYSDADRNYQRWKVTAYNNKFPDKEKYYIYARLEKNGSSALVVYDTVLRGVKGGKITVSFDENGVEIKTEEEVDDSTISHYFIRLGEVSSTDGVSLREITYDTGYLTSDEAVNDKTEESEMWRLDKYSTPVLIEALKDLKSFVVRGFVKLVGGIIFKKGDSEKTIVDVKRSVDSDDEFLLNEDGTIKTDYNGNPIPNSNYVPVSDETLATSRYVDKRVEEVESDKFIRKDQDDETPFSLSVGGDLDITGNSSLGGNLSVEGTVSVDDTATFGRDLDISGSVSVGNEISVTGNSSLGGNLSVEGTVSVDDTATFGKDLDISGSVSVGNEISVTGNSLLGGSLSVEGTVSVDDTATFGKDLDISGSVSVGNEISVTGDSSLGGDLSVEGGASIKGVLNFRGKDISSFTRYYDEQKPFSSDASFYSSLMTDKRIEEEIDDLDERFIRKDKEDTAHKHISFEEGITVYDLAKTLNLEVEELATIARAVVSSLSSSTFVDGFSGEGYQIWKDIA